MDDSRQASAEQTVMINSSQGCVTPGDHTNLFIRRNKSQQKRRGHVSPLGAVFAYNIDRGRAKQINKTNNIPEKAR